MAEKTAEHSSFAGLPAGFVRELLARSGGIADDLYAPFHEIIENRTELRGSLEKNGLLGKAQADERGLCTVSAVDRFDAVVPFPSAGLVVAAAFAVEGIAPPRGTAKWDSPRHSMVYASEKPYAKTAQVLEAVSRELAVELAADAPHDLVLINGSYIEPFVSVMDTLKMAMAEKDTTASREFVKRFKPSIASFKRIFEPAADRIWVGIPRNSAKREVMTALNWPPEYEDTVLFTILLEPGEHTGPVTVDSAEREMVERLPIKDEAFSTVKDAIVNAIRELKVVYFRPHRWTPAFRIELGRTVAEDPPRLARVLASLHYQCRTPGMTLPYPLARAVAMTRDLAGAAPALKKRLISQITNAHREDTGDVFALLMFQP